MTEDASNRLVLITGATGGLGAAAVQAFLEADCHVIAVGRSQSALAALEDATGAGAGSMTLVPMDIRDTDAIERLAHMVEQRWGRLDALVGNAAILGSITPISHISSEEWGRVLEVNLTANWHLLRCFDRLLKKSPAPRVLFVSSGVAYRPRAYWATYAISKAALETMTVIYAQESEASGVLANVLDPGAVATKMRAEAMPGENPETLPQPGDIAPEMVRLCSANIDFTAHRAGANGSCTPI